MNAVLNMWWNILEERGYKIYFITIYIIVYKRIKVFVRGCQFWQIKRNFTGLMLQCPTSKLKNSLTFGIIIIVTTNAYKFLQFIIVYYNSVLCFFYSKSFFCIKSKEKRGIIILLIVHFMGVLIIFNINLFFIG